MAAKDPLPPSISRYKILKRLGEGGMGSLFLARDPEMDRLLAIKLLREDVESDELRERFKREARANARLNHQNIVIVYDVGEDTGRPFIAMEYIEGNTLSGVIRGREDLTLDRKLTLMEQLCDGLAYAHRAGIVHRDIKPANLMLDGRGTLKILDFGIARIGHAAATGMTQAGTLMGTLNYMSPEQMTGRPVDHRTDIFAVGAVVYEFLAYQRAFPGDIQDGVLHRIIHEPPPPLEKFVPGIDKAVLQIVAKALEKDRERRYQDLDAMRADIAKFRARQLLKDEAAAPAVTHDAGTIVVRPSTHPSAPSQPTPGPVTDPRKAELQRRRAKQIETLLDSARTALDSGDADTVFKTCEQVLMLDPDNMVAVELSEKAQSMGEQQAVKTLLADARKHLAQGDPQKASQLVGEALVLNPTSADVLAVRKEVEEAKKREKQQKELANEVREIVETAKKALAQQNIEKAIQLADNALQLDAGSAEAIELKQKATTLIEERRRQQEAAKIAKQQEEDRKRQDDERKRQEAELKKQQQAEAALLAKQQEDERKRQDDERKRQEVELKKQQQAEAARLAKQQDEERKRQEAELRKRQQAEAARLAKQQDEEARRAKTDQEVERKDSGTVTLRPEAVAKAVQTGIPIEVPAPVRYEIPVPVPGKVEKKGGMSPVVMGGAAAAVLVVGIAGYFVFGGKKTDTATGGGTAVPSTMTFIVTPWAHLEFTGKSDASQKAACDASPSCVVPLPPGVYNVRATNDGFKELDFDVTVEAGKSDNVLRSFDGFNAESEVNRLLAR